MKAVGESYGDAAPASQLTENRNVMLTRRGNTLYVHLHTVPTTDAVKLKPISKLPKRATFLNNGAGLALSNELCPADHQGGIGYLRIRGLPADASANTVGVIKLEFDDLESAAAHPAAGKPEGGIQVQ